MAKAIAKQTMTVPSEPFAPEGNVAAIFSLRTK